MQNQKHNQFVADQICASLVIRENLLKDALLSAVSTMNSRMSRLATNVQEDASFNNLGEIQGLGSEIDRLTGQLAMVRQIIADMKNSVDSAEIMWEVFGTKES